MPHVALLRNLHPDAEARLRAEPGFTVEVVKNPHGEELRDAMTRHSVKDAAAQIAD